MSESGWLLERPIDGRAAWWTGRGWSHESLDAIRYARKVDAERARDAAGMKDLCEATDHEWSS